MWPGRQGSYRKSVSKAMGSVCKATLWRAKTSDRIPGEVHPQSGDQQSSQVSFTYKDYRDGAKTKTMTLCNKDFVQRFARHILPHRFVRIKHYVFLSSSWKRGKLQALQQSVQAARPTATIKTLLRKCSCCKTGILVTIDVFEKNVAHHKNIPAGNKIHLLLENG